MKTKPLQKFCGICHKIQIAAICVAAAALIYIVQGCATNTAGTSNAGGIGGSGIHGELNAGTTVDPTNPTDLNVTVGGKIYFAKRPLTPAEKKEIHAAAVNLATSCLKAGPEGCNEQTEKRKLIDRLRYRYRVQWSIIRPLVDGAWKEAQQNRGP